jgi:hypothetical protein
LPRLARSLRIGRITSLGLVANLVGLAGMVVAPSYAIGVGANGLYEGSYGIVTLNAITARQRLTPDALMSRVNTIGRLLGVAGRPMGAAAGAALALTLPLRATLGVMAVGVIASWFVTRFSALRAG